MTTCSCVPGCSFLHILEMNMKYAWYNRALHEVLGSVCLMFDRIVASGNCFLFQAEANSVLCLCHLVLFVARGQCM